MYCLFSVVLSIVFEYICTVLVPQDGYACAVKYIKLYNVNDDPELCTIKRQEH
jgi:hypothetical protein